MLPLYMHVGLCEQGHYFLIDNNGTNNEIVVTSVNTFTKMVKSEVIQDRLPSSQMCGQDFERCNVATLTVGNHTALTIPLLDSVGLLLHNSGNNDIEQCHTYSLSPRNLKRCVFTNFIPIVASRNNEAMGYCIDTSGVLRAFTIIINFASLNLSTIEARPYDDGTYSLGDSATRSNFIHFDNFPPESCFSTDLPHAFFIINNTLIHHGFEDRVYTEIGTINAASTCTKLQRVGECELAAYCGSEVFTFSISEEDQNNFSPNPLPANNGRTFICSSSYFVSIRNSTLTLHDRDTSSPLKNTSIDFDEDNILQGSCQGSTIGSTRFIVALQDTSGSSTLYTVQISQQDSPSITSLVRAESTESNMITYRVRSQYAIIRNRSNTLIYNWTLTCCQEPLSVQSTFTFVSYSSNSVDQCHCPFGPTSSPTTTTLSPTTISTLLTATISVTSPAHSNEVLIHLGVAGFVLVLLLIIILIIGVTVFLCYMCAK